MKNKELFYKEFIELVLSTYYYLQQLTKNFKLLYLDNKDHFLSIKMKKLFLSIDKFMLFLFVKNT